MAREAGRTSARRWAPAGIEPAVSLRRQPELAVLTQGQRRRVAPPVQRAERRCEVFGLGPVNYADGDAVSFEMLGDAGGGASAAVSRDRDVEPLRIGERCSPPSRALHDSSPECHFSDDGPLRCVGPLNPIRSGCDVGTCRLQ